MGVWVYGTYYLCNNTVQSETVLKYKVYVKIFKGKERSPKKERNE